jgi:hypothetical protein
MLAGSWFVANSSLSYRAITGGNLTRGSKSRERLPLGYTYGRTGKGIAPMERSLTKKTKTLFQATSAVSMTLHHLVYHSFPQITSFGLLSPFCENRRFQFLGQVLRIALILLLFQNFLF